MGRAYRNRGASAARGELREIMTSGGRETVRVRRLPDELSEERIEATVSFAHSCRPARQRHAGDMPEKQTRKRAKQDLKRGNSPTTAAGEFVREEIEHIREGKHGARSTKQAIAIGLSKARRAGVPLKARGGKARKQDERDLSKGRTHAKPSRKRSRASERALKREPHRAASRKALSKQAKSAARRRKRSTR